MGESGGAEGGRWGLSHSPLLLGLVSPWRRQSSCVSVGGSSLHRYATDPPGDDSLALVTVATPIHS